MEAQLQVFLTSAMDGGEWSTSRTIVLHAEKGPQWKLCRRMGGTEGLPLLDNEA
jgi:hypothetical protein